MIKWSEQFVLGNKQLDGQHKRLFELISQLEHHLPTHNPLHVRQWHAGIPALLQELSDYADHHFVVEEAFLDSQGCRQLAQHRGCHAQYNRYVKNTIQDILTSHNLTQLEILYRYLKSWWINHVLSEDQLVKQIMVSKSALA